MAKKLGNKERAKAIKTLKGWKKQEEGTRLKKTLFLKILLVLLVGCQESHL